MGGTAPAWQVREMQQQALVERLYKETLDAEQEREEPYTFSVDVAGVILPMLTALLRGEGLLDGIEDRDETDELSAAEQHVFGSIIIPIAEFARTESEGGLMLWKLLEKLLGGSVGQFQSRWQSEVLKDPVTTLGHKERMTEVPIPR